MLTCQGRSCALRCTHREWCGLSGEAHCDFAIRQAPGKGLGVFALRAFEANETALVERPVPRLRSLATCELGARACQSEFTAGCRRSELLAARALSGGSKIVDKISNNQFGCPEAGPQAIGLFLTMSRINNHCIGNCARMFMPGPDAPEDLSARGTKCRVAHGDGAMRLIAAREIAEGEEIVVPYTPPASGRTPSSEPGTEPSIADQRRHLHHAYGFWCQCSACTDPALAEKRTALFNMQTEAPRLRGAGQHDAALQASLKRLALAQEVGLGSGVLAWLYGDLCNTAMERRATVHDAVQYAAQAEIHALAYYGAGPEAQMWRQFKSDPTSHRGYCLCDT